MIEDGNFHIPVGTIKKECFAEIRALLEGGEVRIEICSENQDSTAMQLIASKKAAALQGTITICAHMDSKYDTDGALDNASGVVTMLLAVSDLLEDSIGCTHCPKDKLELVDESLIGDAAAYISRIVDIY